MHQCLIVTILVLEEKTSWGWLLNFRVILLIAGPLPLYINHAHKTSFPVAWVNCTFVSMCPVLLSFSIISHISCTPHFSFFIYNILYFWMISSSATTLNNSFLSIRNCGALDGQATRKLLLLAFLIISGAILNFWMGRLVLLCLCFPRLYENL